MNALAILVPLAVISYAVSVLLIHAAEHARDAATRILAAWEERRHAE